MSVRHNQTKSPRWHTATALLPLALLAGGWTASVGTTTTTSAEAASTDHDVPTVPTTAFDQPASYTDPTAVVPANPISNPDSAGHSGASAVATNGIPTAAVSAYQRSAAILGQADAACKIDWTLIAGIGHVESDHGRYGGNILTDDGQSTPGIYGIPLDGTDGTALIADTDNGHYDDDPIYDRAVGAMQFIPSTWQLVGVDSDGDGARDPQDIDDSSLASAVYLCAGSEDLSTTAGQRVAVFRYNHSQAYVGLVLSIMRSYEAGDYTTVANNLPTSPVIDDPEPTRPGTEPTTPRHQPQPQPRPETKEPLADDNTTNTAPANNPTTDPPPADDKPADPPTDGSPNVSVPIVTDDPVEPTLTERQKATNACTTAFEDAGIDPTTSSLNTCINAYQTGGPAAVDTYIATLGDPLGGGAGLL